MSDDKKQSGMKAAVNTVVGGLFGGVAGGATGALIGAIPGALAGAALAVLSGSTGMIPQATLAGAGLGAVVGGALNAVPGWIAGAMAGFRNTVPGENREQEHQLELARERASGFVEGMDTAGLALLAEQQAALSARKPEWAKRCGERRHAMKFVDFVNEPANTNIPDTLKAR